jgi:3D-(3,5/4)-trihydroxycyclohexane-1,2-dione acylhydrolase (decyclizing)
LLRQGVRKFITVLGHGSTEIGEVLRIYEKAGLVRTFGVRNEIAGAHAAMALRWVRGEKAAVITSIGPGALQALAGSLAALSDGVGVWFLFGDETTEDEGPNMQQIPGRNQQQFLKLCSAMGPSYVLHTPNALPAALRWGLNTVDNPHRGQPFYLLLPMNIQPAAMRSFNVDELPFGAPPSLGPAQDNGAYAKAAAIISKAEKIVIKIGGGARHAGKELVTLLDLADAVAVTSPLVSGVIPFNHPRNMTVGGSKGSISGNWAMGNADVLIAVGTRFVCQSDCSRTAYPNVRQVINCNTDIHDATHYGKTLALVGDVRQTLAQLNRALLKADVLPRAKKSAWLSACAQQRKKWDDFRKKRYSVPTLFDALWRREVFTQPAAIRCATVWARKHGAICFFDAGDVQANGFQIVEDGATGQTYTETGASYMGWAVSALLATGIADKRFYGLAFSGDGSFTMNPQILIDGVNHGATGCIILFDNRRMGAISGLQEAQYGAAHATSDTVEVDYVQWASSVKGVAAFHGGYSTEELEAALDKAHNHKGLSFIAVPVYYGPHELGGMGVFGRWNVGSWVEKTQKLRHTIGL